VEYEEEKEVHKEEVDKEEGVEGRGGRLENLRSTACT